MNNIENYNENVFENIKHVDEYDSEYWYARELMPVLEYSNWQNFHKVIKQAMISCKASNNEALEHFTEVSKTIAMPKGASKLVIDFKLSRYACYLIVQNANPQKKSVALGQTYFAIQTYRQEVADHFNQLDEDRRRLVVRGDIKQWNQFSADSFFQGIKRIAAPIIHP